MNRPLDFPDQIRIRHVREALWRRGAGGASVMVGSGFSRNCGDEGAEQPIAARLGGGGERHARQTESSHQQSGGSGGEASAVDSLGDGTGRLQLFPDGLASYPEAVEEAFGTDVDYAQVVKTLQNEKRRKKRRGQHWGGEAPLRIPPWWTRSR